MAISLSYITRLMKPLVDPTAGGRDGGGGGGGVPGAAANRHGGAGGRVQVRCCRYRFPPTGELKCRGARRVRTQVHCIAYPYCYYKDFMEIIL